MSDAKSPTLPGVLMMLAGLIFKREALLIVASLAVLIIATGATIIYAQERLDGGAAGAVAPVKAQSEATAAALGRHLEDDARDKRETKQVLGELGADIRALYRAQQTGQPQARLERPPQMPDGGP